MSKITGFVWRFFSRFKYHLVIVIGIAVVGFLDENSFMKRFEYDYQIEELKAEIDKYTKRYEADSKRLKELNRNPNAIAKIARERYFMKADDEDIFVLSDDRHANKRKNETIE
ncbi:MAG: septum formation initiator family protein [Prevotella sp.]|nr:septum formation initiator family protein [Prevotella sp.]